MPDEATFAASTENVIADSATVEHDVTADVKDTEAVTKDIVASDVNQAVTDASTEFAEGKVTLEDVHKLVTDIHDEISSVKNVVAELVPHIESVLADVREKGIAGIIPAVMAAFRG